MKDTPKHSKENQLQTYFMSEVGKVINDRGRKMLGWDEMLEGGLAPGATVMSWTGVKGGIEAARLHHDAIMTPIQFLYFSNPTYNRIKGLKALNVSIHLNLFLMNWQRMNENISSVLKDVSGQNGRVTV